MAKLLGRLLLLTVLGGALACGWIFYPEIEGFLAGRLGEEEKAAERGPDPEAYLVAIADLREHRGRLREAYLAAAPGPPQEAVLDNARSLLEAILPRLMECWLGTPWDFNGTAHQPGPDKVACGYFVSSLLQDAGFDVEWAPLAQQPSQNILRSFLPDEDLHIRVDADYDRFVDEVLGLGPGVHIVGLDRHVAFLVVTPEGSMRFIHSSGSSPWCVVDENRASAYTLQRSRYRVFGNLTANRDLLRKWLLDEPFPTQR